MANILYVCDNKADKLYCETLLNSWGHQVTAVEDGWDCVDTLKSSNFNIVILNHPTTSITSYELCKRIKDQEENGFTKVVVLTKDVSLEARKYFYQVHCDNIVPKPLDMEELKLVINKLIQAYDEETEAESKLTLITGLSDLLTDLLPELQGEDFSFVQSYAHSMSLKLNYTNYQRRLYLAAIKLCSYYIAADENCSVIASIDNFLGNFSVGTWLKPSLLYIRLNSLHHQLQEGEREKLLQSRKALQDLGFYPLLQIGNMLIYYYQLCNSTHDKLKALELLKSIAEEKDFAPHQLKQLEQIIIAEDIFTNI